MTNFTKDYDKGVDELKTESRQFSQPGNSDKTGHGQWWVWLLLAVASEPLSEFHGYLDSRALNRPSFPVASTISGTTRKLKRKCMFNYTIILNAWNGRGPLRD